MKSLLDPSDHAPLLQDPGSKPPSKKIRVTYDPSYNVLVPKLKVGVLVRVKGLCEGVKGGEIVITDGWIIPAVHLGQNN